MKSKKQKFTRTIMERNKEKLNKLLKRQRLEIRGLDNYKDLDINIDISKNDAMFTGNKYMYFLHGQSALYCIDLAIFAARKEIKDIRKILDLPCGHGRVLRALSAAFPHAQITACDLNEDGVDFCAKTFNAIPVYSDKDVEKISLNDTFDLIWVGSLFTHLDSDYWKKFFTFFESHLNFGGLFIFTVAGEFVSKLLQYGGREELDDITASIILEEYNRGGFGYVNYPRHKIKNYGRTLSKRSWVMSLLEQFPSLRQLTYTERGWGGRQDVIACIKQEIM